MRKLYASLLYLITVCQPAAPSPLQYLRALVEINSGSGNAEGVRRVQNSVAAELKSLGFTVDIDADRLLTGTFKGKSAKTISLLVHADTVFEPDSPFRRLEVSGETAIGPGVIDDKGGIVVALEGLKGYLRDHPPAYTLRFISSPSEELGSPGLREKFEKMAAESWLVLSFEPPLEDGSIVQSRKGSRWYQIDVQGKEAHSGRAHREGINACRELAGKMVEVSKFTDYRRDVTVSIGHMEGGSDKTNIVCGQAHAKVDTRFVRISDRDVLHRRIERVLRPATVPGSKTVSQIIEDCPPLAASPEARPLVARYLAALEKAEGHASRAGHSGGSADSSYFSRPGTIVIDGLGPVGGKMHTPGEFLKIPTLGTRAEALNLFLRGLP